MMYLPGVMFLFLTSAVIAIPSTIYVKKKSLSIILPAFMSTMVLKLRAYLEMGGFDLSFLIIQVFIGVCAAVFVNYGMERIRKSASGNMKADHET